MLHTDPINKQKLPMTSKIMAILGDFRTKCPSCMWNKEIDTNENCKICLTDNTEYLLSLIRSCKPKKREVPERPDCISDCGNLDDCYYEGMERGEAFGHNSACDLMEKGISEL